MSKTLYLATLPLAASIFKKGDQEGFIVEIGNTNCFVDEHNFHKHFTPANQSQSAPEPQAQAALPAGLDPAYLEGKEDWQVRVIIECAELTEKIDKLNEFIKTDMFDSLPEGQGELLLEQLGAMQTYEKALLARIGTFD